MKDQKLRVLLAEGGLGEIALTLRSLYSETERGLELTVVSTIETLLPTIHVVDPDVLFLDLSLAYPNPLDAVRRVHRAVPDVPLIVLAVAAEKDCAAQCLNNGATDYLQKEHMDSRTLDRVLRTALERNTLKGLTDLLRDPPTGLYIREGFLTLGSRSLETARRNDGKLVLLCALVENLPALRTKFGPASSNRCICEAGEIISGCFRRTDLIARLGEGQFGVLAVDAIGPSAPVLRQRLQKRLAMNNRVRSPWGRLELRISIGFWCAPDARSFTEFLDSVETDLRQTPAAPEAPSALRDAIA